MKVRAGVASEEVKTPTTATLFVEGSSPKTIDVTVLKTLFEENGLFLEIKHLGGNCNLINVAKSMYEYHPDYYFIIDRDSRTKEDLDSFWNNFPSEDTYNLLMWERKEIENYFLDPDYLEKSLYLNKEKQFLEQTIIDTVQRRIYLDAANIVIANLRQNIENFWVRNFESVEGFNTKENALDKLLTDTAFSEMCTNITDKLGKKVIEKMFNDTVESLLDGGDQVEFGKGSWMECITAKKVLPTVISNCFYVKDNDNNRVQGNEAINEVVKELLRQELSSQPDDFQRLFNVISKKLKK